MALKSTDYINTLPRGENTARTCYLRSALRSFPDTGEQVEFPWLTHQTLGRILPLQSNRNLWEGRENEMLTSSLVPTSSPHSFFAPHTAEKSTTKSKMHVRPSVIPRILESRSFPCSHRCRFLSSLLCLVLKSPTQGRGRDEYTAAVMSVGVLYS